MIKKIIFIFVTISLLFASCKDRPNVSIEGNLRYAEKGALNLEYLDINKTRLIDSIQVKKDGSFHFTVYVDSPGLYILKNSAGKIINLLVYPGEKVKVESDYKEFDKNYSVNGSPDSEFIRQLVEKLSDTRDQLKKLEEAYRGKINLTESMANEFLNRRNEILKDQRDFSIGFIVEHLSSIASIYALYQKLNPNELVLNENRDIQYMKIVADTLSLKYPNSVFVSTFVKDARTAEKRYNNLIGMQKKIMEAQTSLPDISYPDPDARLRSLSSLKGKLVLLYFWSVTSDATQQLNPAFEKTYRKYKNKGFEIFAVCLDNNRDNWLKMIRFDGLSFINVFGPGFPESENSRLYNLRSIPCTYLLDKEGNVIARDLFGAELEKWLDNKL